MFFCDPNQATFSTLMLLIGCGLENETSRLTFGNLPPLSPSFFLRKTPKTKSWRFHLRRLPTRHCTTERLRIQQDDCYSYSVYSWSVVNPLYCVIRWPHLYCATETTSPNLRTDINLLERVQRIATRLVRGLRHVPYEKSPRQFNLFQQVFPGELIITL